MIRPHHPLTFDHLPGLDGLRGLAVLIVMCVHFNNLFGLTLASVGVDIFFVLSGFLITTLLIVEFENTGRLSFRNFYLRRALRLTPALLLAVALFGAVDLFLGVNERGLVLQSMGVSALFYVSNWIRALDLWNMIEFGHTWSLAIEEQFYLLWPISFVALLWISRRNYVAVAAIVGGLIIVVAANRAHAVLGGAPREWVSAGTHFRVDAIFAGIVAALLLARYRPRPSRLAFIAGMAGLGAICAVLAFHRQYLLWQQPIVVAGTCAMLVHLKVNKGTWMHRAFSARWLVYTGVISYGLYLYHYPLVYLSIYRFGGDWRDETKQVIGLLILFPLSFALAAVSYRYVEAPLLRLKRRFAPLAAAPAEQISRRQADGGQSTDFGNRAGRDACCSSRGGAKATQTDGAATEAEDSPTREGRQPKAGPGRHWATCEDAGRETAPDAGLTSLSPPDAQLGGRRPHAFGRRYRTGR